MTTLGIKGVLKRCAYTGIGLAYAVPQSLALAFNFAGNPKSFLASTNFNALALPPPLPDLHHQMVELSPEISIHTVRTFQGNRPTKPVMVMVHGFPESWFSWKKQIEEFRQDYDVVAISMRGYCMSSKPKGVENYTVDKIVEDIVGVIRSLGIGQVTLVAHDWGGYACWHLAYRYPELISKFVVACTPHPKAANKNMDLNQFFRSWYIFFFQVPYLPELSLSSQGYKFFNNVFFTPPMGLRNPSALSREEVDAYKKELARPGALESAVNYYRGLMVTSCYGLPQDYVDALRKPLKVPTLYIWADSDAALGPQLLRGVEKYVDHIKIVIMKDCSHWAQQDRSEEFNKLVRDFLNDNGDEE